MLNRQSLRKIAFKIGKNANDIYRLSVNKQESYISKFSKPKDDIERSYYQYCCQMRLGGKIYSVILNIVSLPLVIRYLMKSKHTLATDRHYDAVFINEGVLKESVIPEQLKQEYSDWIYTDSSVEVLDETLKKYFLGILKRYPFSWHFLFKAILKLQTYNYLINNYSPQAIVACTEYSFVSSLLTDFCNKKGVQHINVMHGEKLFFMRDSFFHFNKCYVWDEYYKELFIRLKADEEQFVVEKPQSMMLSDDSVKSKEVDFTYYLGAETGSKLKKIIFNLKTLSLAGYKICIRPHPIYTNISELEKDAEGIEIEDNKMVNISKSILRTRNVVSLYSTVLNQAFNCNVDIVIDDVTDPDSYKKLKKMGYIMLNKPHKCFSEIIEGVKEI